MVAYCQRSLVIKMTNIYKNTRLLAENKMIQKIKNGGSLKVA